MLIHFAAVVFLCHHPEDDRTIARNMLVNILLKRLVHTDHRGSRCGV